MSKPRLPGAGRISQSRRPSKPRTAVCALRWLAQLGTALSLASAGPAALAKEAPFYEEITVVGSREQAREVNGAAHVIDPELLRQFAYSDIQRIARRVPGVSVQVEDGYGLRPNISIRGVASERSGRITLLEDGVLIAPAPYSAPSAYYFPTVGRMAAFEVLKGPAAITEGPYTIGGALNMISTPIPEAWTGGLTAVAGEDATGRAHVHYGGTSAAGAGLLLETHLWRSDGYQRIDRSSGGTGLNVEDFTAKASLAPPNSRHSLELKLQLAVQDSDQSYLGLTDSDFAARPFRRYGLSQLDRIDTRHEQAVLRYGFSWGEELRLTASVYNNEHQRDWFKTEGIDFDGSDAAENLSRTSWARVVRAVNVGQSLGGRSPEQLAAILDGRVDTPPGSVELRSNARQYFSRGLQTRLDWQAQLGGARHEVEFGARLHEDAEDRLQRSSSYRQERGRLLLDDLGALGNAGNRIERARAVALHVQDRIAIDSGAGRWLLTPGLRYERIAQRRQRFETRPGRTGAPASRINNLRDRRRNDTRVWLPGLGVGFEPAAGGGPSRWHLFAGVHKGFTAPTNAPGVDEEQAINWELGARAHGERWHAELTGFASDYDNLLGVCTASSGTDCEVGDAFNGDAATVRGLELLLDAELARGSYGVPLRIAYTWMDAKFDSDIADTDFFGAVGRGDPLPYVPSHQASASLGVERGALAAHGALNYVDAVCVRAACGDFERTDAALTLDVAGSWAVSERLDLFARVENVADSRALLGRHPYGARPNKARTASIGVRVAL